MSATLTDRQTIILDATLDLAAERGLLGTTISQIAKRAEASPGIIYHYFESKEALIHALHQKVEQAFLAALLDNVDLSQPWRPRMTAIWLNAFHYFVAHPRQTLFLEQYKNSAFYSNSDWTTNSDEALQQLIATIEADMQTGEIRAMSFYVLYAMTVGVAISLAKLEIGGMVTFSEAELVDLAAGICMSLAAE